MDLKKRIYRAIKDFPRYNQFILNAHDSILTLVESHILLETDSKNGIPQSDLQNRLILEKTALSKILKNMRMKKLISFDTNKEDKRAKIVKISKYGKKLLDNFDQQANYQLNFFQKNAKLNLSEVKKLSTFLNRLSDSIKEINTNIRTNEHLLRPVIRKLTRNYTILEKHYLETSLNVLEWQTLLLVSEKSNSLSPSTLTKLLNVDKVLISNALSKLLSKKLISKNINHEDTRSIIINCSNKGYDLLNEIEEKAIKEYNFIKNIKEDDVILLEKFIRGAALYFYFDRENLIIKKINSDDDYQKTRRYLLKKFNSNSNLNIPGCLFHESNSNCIALKDKKIFIALEYKVIKSDKIEIINLAYKKDLHPDTINSFFIKILALELDHKIILDFINENYLPKNKSEILSSLGAIVTHKS